MGENIDAARKFWDPDRAKAAEALHPDVVLHEAAGLPYGGDYHGRAGFAELSRRIYGLFDIDIRSVKIVDAGNTVVAILSTVFKLRSSRSTLETSVIDIYRFTEGLISDIDVYYKDTKAVADLVAEAAAAKAE